VGLEGWQAQTASGFRTAPLCATVRILDWVLLVRGAGFGNDHGSTNSATGGPLCRGLWYLVRQSSARCSAGIVIEP